MEERSLSIDPAPTPTRSDWRWLLLLVTIAVGLRAWQIGTTELTSRDSVAYIRYAWRLGHEPWRHVVTHEIHHPGYGFLVAAVARPVRLLIPDDLPRAMQLSAQLAASLAGILLVLPMYFLGKSLFDRRVGFWATLLFQLLPSSGRLMADGLSEPLFLLGVTSALYFVNRAMVEGALKFFLLGGLCSGLAYLTRTEGLIVVPAALLVLLVRRKGPWVRQSLVLTGSCAALAAPFMLLIGGVSLKASFKNIPDGKGWEMPARPAAAVASPLPLAAWWIDPGVTPNDRVGWATRALLVTLDKGFFHVFGPLALLGLWVYRRRFAEAPGAAVMLVAGLTLLALLWKLAQSAGYIGDRHVLLVVLGGMYFSAAAVAWITSRWPAWAATLAFAALAGACLPKTLAPLHANRSGFRDAGRWLAANSWPGDEVFDPLAWTSYHAGRLFVSEDAPRSDPPVCYVVLEESANQHPHLWYLLDLARELTRDGAEVVYRSRLSRGVEIVIYRVARPPERTVAGHQLQVWLSVNMGRRAH
ncbi:MAG: glycosyltransferase family 39 protein [Gemmataceae bacterium]